MGSIIYAAIMGLLWIVNLFNGTGLDSVYHVTQYTRQIVIVLSVGYFIYRHRGRGKFLVARKDFFTFGLMILLFSLNSLINGYGFQAIQYLWVFGLVYLLSHLELDEKVFLWTGIAYGIGGLLILYIYDYGTLLQGWNANSIAMIGMHSFLMMLIPLFNRTSISSKMFLLIITVIYANLIYPTDSRSCIFFMIIGFLLAINIIPRKLIYGRKGRITFFLLVPLIVSIVAVLVSGTELHDTLNVWSYRQFDKPIFNGRDVIWRNGFEVLFNNFLFGAGSMNISAWHNSAITCLFAFGCVGYLLWLSSFKNILSRAYKWLNDYIIQGCVVSFFVLYMQQSVELGFISSSPSIIAYIMLGMMLGRIRNLQKKEEYLIAKN